MRRALVIVVACVGIGLAGLAWLTLDAGESGDGVGGLVDEPADPDVGDEPPALPPPPPGQPIRRDTGTPRDEGEPPEWM